MRHMLLIACAAAMGATTPAAAQQPPFNPVFDPEPDPEPDPDPLLNPGPIPLVQPQPTQPAPRSGPISLLPRVLTEPDGADLAEDDPDASADQNGAQDPAAPVAAALNPADLTPDRAALEAAIPFGGARPTPNAGADADAAQDDGGGADPNAADLAPGADVEPGVDASLDPSLDLGAAAGEEEPDPDVIPPYALVSDPQPRPGAVLRVLNQRAGETQTASLQTGDTLTIGALAIRLEACLSGPRPLDAAALVVIRPHDDPQATPLYAGWMSAAAPSLTTMQHPDYDVWVARCMTES